MTKQKTLSNVFEGGTTEEPTLSNHEESTPSNQEPSITPDTTPTQDRTIGQAKTEYEEEYKRKANQPRKEDTHERYTFMFNKDLKKRLDKLAKGKRGYKTGFINHAIEELLKAYEK